MNFNFSFDTTVPLDARNALIAVANVVDGAFSNNVGVNVTVGWGNVAGMALPTGALGSSDSSILSYSTSSVLAALQAQTGAMSDIVKAAAFASLADVSTPTVLLTPAEAKALNLYSSIATDGYIGFGSTVAWAFTQSGISNTAYDFMGTAFHEIIEVMGKISNYDGAAGTPTLLDLFRYTAPSVRAIGTAVTGGAPNYFSFDHGTSNFGKFNTNPSGDLGDWATNAGGAVANSDAANAFLGSGTVANFSKGDFEILDALGWKWTGAAALNNIGQGHNDLSHSSTVSGYNHFIDLLNFEASFSDLIAAFGNNQNAMQSWYSTIEPAEQRIANFDGLDYIASYRDLIAVFKTGSLSQVQDSGAMHYISNGNHENRAISFNGLDYIASYSDLIKTFGANNDAGAYHYIESGATEGRTTNFDGFAYIAQYTDLMKAFGSNEQAGAEHYIQNGLNEHRATSFDVASYYVAHPDLLGHYANADAFLTAYIDQYSHFGTFLV